MQRTTVLVLLTSLCMSPIIAAACVTCDLNNQGCFVCVAYNGSNGGGIISATCRTTQCKNGSNLCFQSGQCYPTCPPVCNAPSASPSTSSGEMSWKPSDLLDGQTLWIDRTGGSIKHTSRFGCSDDGATITSRDHWMRLDNKGRVTGTGPVKLGSPDRFVKE